jgi:hypothetical protein
MRWAAASFPGGFVLDGLDAKSIARRGSHLLARESFLTGVLGRCAFEPGLEEGAWTALWPELDAGAAPPLSRALAALEEAWKELALLQRGSPAWTPLLPEDEERAPGAMRDSRPAIGLIEIVFTRSADPGRLSIPESVALEVRGKAAGPRGVHALDVSKAILEKSRAALESVKALLSSPQMDSRGDPAWRLAAEIGGLSRIAACHGKRIRAGVFLLRHAAGLGRGAREEALNELAEAAREISLARDALQALRDDEPHGLSARGMDSWLAVLEEDTRVVSAARPDTAGFRAAPLLEAPIPLPPSFDYEEVRGFLHWGAGMLDNPAIALTEDSQLFEAEDMVGSWQASREIHGFSGTGCLSSGVVGSPAGGGPVLRVRVDRPGTFQAWVRAVEGGGESCALRLRAQGALLPPTHASVQGPRRLEWRKAGQMTLAAGEVFLQVVDDGAGRESIDAFVLSRDPQWVPPES